MNLLHKLFKNHQAFWSKEHVFLLLTGLGFLGVALFIQRFSYNYIENHASTTPVGDLLLDNLPTLDLDFFVVQAPLILTVVVLGLLLFYPKYLPFSLKALALLLITRSFFIGLTHLGTNLHQLQLNPESFGFGMYDFLYNAKNDFFFSGHVGAPFLFGLIFWNDWVWRYFFFTTSVILGIAMILAHMHYSIDVFAAPFIIYGIFVFSKKVFNVDFQLIQNY